MKFGIERKVGNLWEVVRPPTAPPYEFGTELEAKTMARVLYPGVPIGESIRIVEKKEQGS